MNTPCQCPIAGYCDRHNRLMAPRMHELCQTDQRYFDLWSGKATESKRTSVERKKQARRKPVHGPGSELKKLLAAKGYATKTECGCKDKIDKMNFWGPEECRRRLDEITDWLVAAATSAGWKEWAAVTMPGVSDIVRRELRKMITQAINAADTEHETAAGRAGNF